MDNWWLLISYLAVGIFWVLFRVTSKRSQEGLVEFRKTTDRTEQQVNELLGFVVILGILTWPLSIITFLYRNLFTEDKG